MSTPHAKSLIWYGVLRTQRDGKLPRASTSVSGVDLFSMPGMFATLAPELQLESVIRMWQLGLFQQHSTTYTIDGQRPTITPVMPPHPTAPPLPPIPLSLH